MINKVFWDITNYCNGNCKYCFTNSISNINNNANEMSYTEIEKLIDGLIVLGIKDLSISGGEPFLRDICKIIKYIDNRLNISITSNGTIVSQEIINCLSDYNVKITISLDAIDQNISNKIRCGIDTNLVITNIKKLLQNSTISNNLSIRTTISKYNIDHIIDMVDFCENNNIRRLKINSVNNFGRAKITDVIPDFEKFMKTLDFVIDYCIINDVSTKISLPIEKYITKDLRRCTLGNESIYINSLGDVYPCAFSEGNLHWGNVTEKSLSEILKANWDHNNNYCSNCPINRYKIYKPKTV